MDKKKKIIIYSLIALCFVNVLIILTAYAFWQTDKKQSKKNVAASACLKITFHEDSPAILLEDAYPTSDEDGIASFGYNYSVVNTCDNDVSYQIVLESLPVSSNGYIDYHDIKVQFDNGSIYRYDELVDEDKDPEANYDIRDTKHLFNKVVAGRATNSHNIKIWLASDASLDNRGKVFSGRIKIYAGDVNINEQEKYAADSCFTAQLLSSTFTITDFDYENCNTNRLVIPNSINGEPVKSISFTKDDVSSVGHPKTPLDNFIESLEYLDISNMTSLTNIPAYSLMTYRGENQELVLPSNVTNVGYKAFNRFNGSNLVLNDNLRTISSMAFNSYHGEDSSLTIPNSVISVGSYAFMAFRGNNLVFGNSITTIGDMAFQCYVGTGKKLVLPNSLQTLGGCSFWFYNGDEVILNEGITSIGYRAFRSYVGANKKLTLPSTLTRIDEGAFYSYVGNDQVLTISNATTDIGIASGNKTFDSFENTYLSGETGNSQIRYKYISDYGAFYSFNGSDLKLGNGLKNIWFNSFKSYVGTGKDLTIPNSTEKIGSGAFKSFNGSNLTIGNSVQYIGHEAFYSYVGDGKTINIPSTITTIGQDAFKSLASSATIVINKPSLEGLTLGNNWNGNAHIKCKNNNQIIDCPNN